MKDLRRQLISSLQANQHFYDISLNLKQLNELADYYEFVQKHNEILHLVAPCSPEEFATRHVLESLTLTNFLPKEAKFTDVGAGAGLPSVPCLLVRQDLRGVLIESKSKKAEFLREVTTKFELRNRARILNNQFEELQKPEVSYVTCRALDKFARKMPKLLKWSGNSSLLLFGGSAVRQELEKNSVRFDEKLMPLSERRYLFVSR